MAIHSFGSYNASTTARTQIMTPNVAVHPAEGRREAPLPRIGCNGLLALTLTSLSGECIVLDVFDCLKKFDCGNGIERVARI
jgi:hypothetical protein